MIALFRKSKLPLLPLGLQVLQILEQFHIEIDEEDTIRETCRVCSGSGRDEDDEGEKCEECGGSGEIEQSNPDRGGIANEHKLSGLDDQYYAINNEWMKQVNEYLAKWFEANKDPLETQEVNLPQAETPLPKPRVRLTGHDGNVFAFIGTVSRALREAHYPDGKIQQFQTEARSSDYTNALATACKWAEVS